MAQQLEHLKWINGTNFMVDGFNFQNGRCKNYFLTHFHSDHTTGLNRSFSSGVIYCSPITATLLTKDMGMPAERVIPLPVDIPIVIDTVSVTLMDANHCPGACMMLFKVPSKTGEPQVILHTGDMRWQPRLAEHPALKACKVELLYMDTTYCLPKHVFPSQDKAIASLAKVMREAYAEERKTLFVVGSYHIGKERAFFGAARALGFKIWCHQAKKKVMQWCEMPTADMDCLVSKESAAQIHVVFMGQGLQPEALEQRRLKGDYVKIIAFRPTGWSYQKKGLQTRREGNVTIYGIPYSEHSSFVELRDCVKRLRPKRIIPTVNCPDAASARAIVDRFADLMDLSKDKSRLDSYFGRTASAPVATLTGSPPATCMDSALEAEFPSAEVGGDNDAVLEYKPNTLLNDRLIDHQPCTRDVIDPVHLKREDSPGIGLQRDSGTVDGLNIYHSHIQDQFDDTDKSWTSAHEQTLPMRAKAVPQHAHSAPAVLSPSARHKSCKPLSHAPAAAADLSVRRDSGHAAEPDSCAEEHLQGADVSIPNDDAANCVAKHVAEVQQLGQDDPLSCSMNWGEQPEAPIARLAACGAEAGCRPEAACTGSVAVLQGQPNMSLLDGVDIEEHSRILCQIQQQLYTKQCLTSKKRQMTLGCFVGHKRLK